MLLPTKAYIIETAWGKKQACEMKKIKIVGNNDISSNRLHINI